MEQYKENIYKVITSTGTGSGFCVKDYDFVITNYHVVEGTKILAIEDQNQNRYLAHVVMVNPEADLAFLSVEGLNTSTSNITLDKELQVSNTQKVFINGYPFGMPFTITEGIISSANQPMGNRHYIQTDAAVNPGNSGGPMINQSGVLVGVTTSKFDNADNVGFAIRFNELIKEIEDFNFTDNVYRVKCNSCDNFIETEVKFCPHCGSNINSSVFEEFEKSHFANFIESAMEEMGANPILCRAGRDNWEFHQGSALLRIFVYQRDYLIVTSPLAKLPKQNLLPLYEYLLSHPHLPYSFGISDNTIYLSYRVHLSDVFSDDSDKIKQYVRNMPALADDLDNLLVEKYGCEFSIEAKLD
ncbi:trypsin-like peptidase domain-containing protein [Capnocytophaga catalasegens]|uniref:Protease n=1 Tax=Capnocytophaga catalasegens TaxID=1004260 RepID=A0AAV5AVQ6_9FLAO|nr:trypsin-like peptidase domain-containing protein [Capnocytophaga catalasegens]GIZ15246.1 protease [Capnocytophaga catalasegens]GJM49760.1 protease [Capnocytophaga catalasegens]GJM52825.1 protease [Capnocytophaga catalasegens]